MWQEESLQNFCFDNVKGRDHLGDGDIDWRTIFATDFIKIMCLCWGWFKLAQFGIRTTRANLRRK
jgi:hypothetical protein